MGDDKVIGFSITNGSKAAAWFKYIIELVIILLAIYGSFIKMSGQIDNLEKTVMNLQSHVDNLERMHMTP